MDEELQAEATPKEANGGRSLPAAGLSHPIRSSILTGRRLTKSIASVSEVLELR